MAKNQTAVQPSNKDLMEEVKSAKGMIANQGKVLKKHSDRLTSLERRNRDEDIAKQAAKEAVSEYKKNEPQKEGQGIGLTKELRNVIITLAAVIAALVALLKAGGNL